MKKIPTIFDRDWDGDGKIIDSLSDTFDFGSAIATEKIDGTNIRLTIRNGQVVRVEKRCNPSKVQKAQGITEPWYVDADEYSKEDKHIYSAVRNRIYENIPDGEWSGEAYGLNIQGNPLNLDKNTVCLFSCGEAPVIENVPTTYQALKAWLPNQQSKLGNGKIEGIVWHWQVNGEMAKIKTKDFKIE